MNFDTRLRDSIRRLEASTVDESPELLRIVSAEALPRAERPRSGLTIFIPNWNHETVLPRALKSAFEAVSALKREGFETEILFIDDASRDASLKLVRTIRAMYNVSNLRVIAMEKNYGQARLTNLALKVSHFRYVLRLDADNQLTPQNTVAFLRSMIQTKATLLYGNLIRLQEGQLAEQNEMVSHMPATLHLTQQNYIDALCIVDAFAVMELGGYARVNPYSPEDWEMNLHLIAHESLIVFVPLLMGYYHMGAQSASTELSKTESGNKVIRRIYAQDGPRPWDNQRVGRIYHPETGYLDEWEH